MYNNRLIAFINKGLSHSTALNTVILQLTSVCLFFPIRSDKFANRWEKTVSKWRTSKWSVAEVMAVNINHAAGTDSTLRIVYSRPKTLFPYFMEGWRETGKFIVQPSACGREQILLSLLYFMWNLYFCTSPRGLRLGCAAARLLGLRVRIPPREWMPLACERFVLSRRGLCVGLITPTEESYWLWCVRVWLFILYNEKALAH